MQQVFEKSAKNQGLFFANEVAKAAKKVHKKCDEEYTMERVKLQSQEKGQKEMFDQAKEQLDEILVQIKNEVN